MPSPRVPSTSENEVRGITLFDALPARASRNTVSVNGVQLGYSLIEPSASEFAGSPRGTAVLVAGYTSSYDTFNTFLAPLADNGYRVIGLSQRGQPHSTGPDSVEGYSLEQLGADIHSFIDAVSKKHGVSGPIHVLGHSFGGVIVQEAVLQDARTFASVTLWNSGPKDFGEGGPAHQALLADGTRGLWVLDCMRVGRDPDAELNVIERYYFDRLMTTKYEQLVAGAAILRDQVDRTAELAARAGASGTRFLISHGAQDDAWPVDWQRDMAFALGADYVVLANAGHSSHGDRPNVAADVLATFWSDSTTSLF